MANRDNRIINQPRSGERRGANFESVYQFLNQIQNELTNEYVTSENDFEMYVVESSLLEIINIRNSLLPPAVG